MKKTIILILTLSMLLLAKNKYEYATVKISGLKDIKFMQENKIDIDRTSFQGKSKGLPEVLNVYINDEEFQTLINEGYSVDWAPLRLPKDATDFRYNEDIGDSMLVWQNRYPSICKRIQIGTSVQGRPLWVLKISDNVDIEEAEPELKFVSTMHGDEVTGVEMEMYMIEDILYGYQANNDTMQFIVNNTELYVIPLMNPDGMANNSRYNANFVDLNRNFPEFTYGEPNDPALEEVEIAALINWSNTHNFVLSTNYHGGALVTNYGLDIDPDVPNYSYAAAPDDEHLTWLAYNYSVRNIPMFNSLSFTDGITNGSEWYQISGGMQDWNYHYYNDIDLTLEISSIKWPAFNEMAGFWQDNRDAMFWYLSAAHKGIYGIVTDYDTGLPLDAKIFIGGIDKEYNTDSDHGDYYRILKEGTYSLTVSASGYVAQTIDNIVVTDNTGIFKEATEINVQLVKSTAQVLPIEEGLEIGATPIDWTQDGSSSWIFRSGGLSGTPSLPHSGSYNANYDVALGNSTKLITPALDLTNYVNVQVVFWYVTTRKSNNNDNMKVYYSASSDPYSWVEIGDYSVALTNWTEEPGIVISDAVLSSDFSIAFEGFDNGANGISLDDISITGDLTILLAPENIILSHTGTEAQLSWGAVSGANIYNVYRSTDPYQIDWGAPIGTSNTNSYNDLDILLGNKYFYKVTADNVKIEIAK